MILGMALLVVLTERVTTSATGKSSPTHLALARWSSAVQGFADHVSIATGASFRLFVKCAQPWTVTAYRLGWYGGTDERVVWTSDVQPPHAQPDPDTNPANRAVVAPWHASLTIRARDWPAGVYVLKLRTLHGEQNTVLITVRSPSAAGRTVFMTSDLTLQAYNHWGGRSLYAGPDKAFATRAYAVSFDRPYDDRTTDRLLDTEQPLIAEAERLHLPLAYFSDVDVATDPHLLAGARAIVIDGHDEYWTRGERSAVTAARDHGTNLAFFGANQLWWQVRLASTSLGAHRLVLCYKSAALDPVTRARPELATTHFRFLRRPLPESELIGVQYAGRTIAPYVVYSPTFFAFRGTGARRGSAYPGLVGPEVDSVNPGRYSPAGLEVVGHSPAHCMYGRNCWSDSSYYVAGSGAGVWAAGTMGWVDALGAGVLHLGATTATREFVRTVTDNLLRDFSIGPAGLRHPSTANLSGVQESNPAANDD